MRKTLCTAFAAAAVLTVTAPANQATAMPLISSAATGAAAKTSGAAMPVHYRRHHYWARRETYWYPRHYWYAPPLPYPHYDILASYWGNFWYDPGQYGGRDGKIPGRPALTRGNHAH